MKVLVVDDSAVMRKVVVGAFQRVGIDEADQAADGCEALQLALTNDYCMVTLDWNMPEMNGLETLKALREAGKSVPVMMITTEGEKVRIVEALRAGANNYIVKPFTPETIVTKIKQMLAIEPQS